MKALTLVALLAAGAAHAQGVVDLDRPGMLESVQRDNPEHFARIERILREAPRRPLTTLQGWMRTEFDARDVARPSMLRTSYPPQTDLAFRLGDTHYRKRIYVEITGAITPAK